jgi:VWFA-related protein
MKRDTIALWTLASLTLGLSLAPSAAQEKPKPAPEASTPKPAETPMPTFPAQIELVNVDTVVTDKKGTSITGLTKDDFTITEDGSPQTIATFEAIVIPARSSGARPARPRVSTNQGIEQQTGRSFILVFDDIHLTPFQAHRAKTAVAEFLKNGVREGDVVTLVATGGAAWWTTRMEAGREDLLRLLKRLDGRHIPDLSPERITDYEALRIHVYRDAQVAQRVQRRFETYGISQNRAGGEAAYGAGEDPLVFGRAAEVYYQATAKNRITLEVVQRILDSLTAVKGRKSLILVSEGFIYDPNLDEFKRVVMASRRANVAIYFLDTRGLGGLPVTSTAQFGPALPEQDLGAAFTENLEASEGSESIASETGGFTVKNTNDLAKGIQRIADESRAYYLLGYYPTNTKRDGRFRKIQVKVARKGVEVRARKGYYAPLEGGKGVATAAKKGSDPAIQAALDSPYILTEIPLRMTEYVMDETILGKANVLLAAEADAADFAFEEQDGRFVDSLDLLLVVAHHETGEYFTYPRKMDMKLRAETRERLRKDWLALPVDQRFELSPGRYQAKLVVRDQNSSRVGTLFHEFEVPDLAALRVSTPIVTDKLYPKAEAERHPIPMAIARRTFPMSAMLYCQFEVFGAAKDKSTGMPKVSAGYSLRRLDGTVASQVEPTPIQPTSLGKLSRLVGTSLASTIPGEYELVLTVRDELAGKTVEVREPFTVTADVAPGTGSQP